MLPLPRTKKLFSMKSKPAFWLDSVFTNRNNGLKHTILYKTYYREKDLHEFIWRYFDGENVGKSKTEECNEGERARDGMLSDNENEATDLANNLTLCVSFVLS